MEPDSGKDEEVWPQPGQGAAQEAGNERGWGVCVCVCVCVWRGGARSLRVDFEKGVLQGQPPLWSRRIRWGHPHAPRSEAQGCGQWELGGPAGTG